MHERKEERYLIVFDGKCVFCSGFAQFITKHDKADVFQFVTAHSAMGRDLYLKHGLDPDLMETNIVIMGDKAYIKMQALSAAFSQLGWPWKIAKVLDIFPRGVMNWVYDQIAQNRYRFGRQACPMPSPELKAKIIE